MTEWHAVWRAYGRLQSMTFTSWVAAANFLRAIMEAAAPDGIDVVERALAKADGEFSAQLGRCHFSLQRGGEVDAEQLSLPLEGRHDP